MYVIGASKASALRGGVYMQGSLVMKSELRVEFQFPVTNNVAEYEVLVAGLNMARESASDTLSSTVTLN